MIDARLLVPAVGVWIGAAGGLAWLGGQALLAERSEFAGSALRTLLLAGVAGGVIGIVSAVRWRPLLGDAVRLVLLAGGALLVGILAACAWTVSTMPQPVAGWVDMRATATVTGYVTDEARTRTVTTALAWGETSWTEVRMRAVRIAARGSAVDVRIPLLLRLPVDASPPAPGSAITVLGRLNPPLGSGATAATLRTRGEAIRLVSPPGPLDSLAHRMRVGLQAALVGTAPDAGALVAGLALGDESGQPAELTAAMRASGLAHLTAVSGGNVAIVLGSVLALAALVRLRLWARTVAAAAALGFFVLLVGGQPSVLRAAVMGAAALVAVQAGGRRAGPSVLGAAVVILVVLQPWLALAWGFALSVLATAGLVLLAPVVADRLARWRPTRRWPPALREATALTVAAQLATLPVLVAMGAAVGWVSVPANLAAMPAVVPVTILGLGAAGVSVVLPGVAAPMAHLAAWPAGWIAGVAHVAAGLPAARLSWPSGWLGVAGLLLLSAVAWALRRLWVTRIAPDAPMPVRWAVLGALALLGAVVVLAPPDRRDWPPRGWFMIMCDVGQGDALLLRSGAGHAVVVDAGPDPDLIDGCLSDAGIVAVDAVVLTHFHADHVRGLAGVLRGRSVGSVLTTPVREPAEEAAAVDQVLAAQQLAAEAISAGDVRRAGEVRWRALWPRRRIESGSVPNNASVVLVAEVRGRSVLLAGDIEPEAQSAMSADLRALHVDVAKVPHHGSANQQPDLPHWVPAPVALISVGAGNDYGHPAPETVAAWEAVGSLVARTDEDGDVAVVVTASGTGLVTRRDMLPSS